MEEMFMQVFERRDWVKAQMRHQVVSYSQSIACTLLAAGHNPPPWLLPPPAVAVATQGNTLRNPYLDLADQKNADGVQHALPEAHQRVEPKTLEFDGVKPGSLHIPKCSETVNQCQKRVSETVLIEFTATYSLNEDPSSTNSLEVPPSVVISLLQTDTLHSVEANLHEVPHFVTDSLEGPTSMASLLLENDSLQCVEPNFLEEPDSVASPLPEKDAIQIAEIDSLEGPHPTASRPLEKDILHSDEVNILVGPHSMGSLLPEKETLHTSETDSLEEPQPMASPLFEKARLHCVETNFLEGPHSMASLLLEKETGHASETIYHEGTYCMVSPQLDKDPLHTLEHTETLRGPHSIGILLPEKQPTHTAETDSLEEPLPMASPLLEKATLHCVETNFLEGPHSMASILLEKETGHSSETICHEGFHCMVSPQLEKDSLHTVENTETLRKRSSFSDKSIDDISKILEQQSSECHVLPPPCNESSLQSAHLADTTSGAPEMLGMPQENMLDDDCGRSSHPLENILEDDCGHYSHSKLGGAFSRCSLAKSAADREKLLPKSANDGDVYQNSIVSSGTMINHNDSNSACATNAFVSAQNKPSQMQSSLAKPSIKFDRTGTVVDTHMVSSTLFTSNESLKKEPVLDSVNNHPEQSGHAQAKFSTQSEAYDVSVRNILDESVTPGALSSFSSKNARMLHTAERDSTISADKCLRSLQHEGGEQSTGSHLHRSTASGIQAQGNSSCEKGAMNCQSDHVLYTSSSTMSTPSLDCQDDFHDQLETRADLSGKPQPSVRYFLSSSGSRECISFNSKGRGNASNWKSPVAHEVHGSANFPPERSVASLSDVICCNSPSMKASSCNGSSPVEMVPQCSQSNSLENDLDAVTSSSPSCSDILSDSDGHCVRKTNSCFKYPDADVKTVTVEDQVLTQMDYVASGSGVSNPENYALDQHGQQACASNESIQEKSSYDSNLELNKTGIDYDPGQPVSDGTIPWQNGDNYADCDETVQQRQRFSIPIPSNSPSIEERAFEAFCDSTKLVNLSSNLSVKYKMNSKMESLSGVYQSLAARFEKLMNRSSLDSVDTKRCDQSYTNKLGMSGKYSLEFDGSFLMPNALTYDSSNANSVQGDSEIPLTPSVEKYSVEKLSGRTGSSSECMGSIPEPACFRIDEDSSIAEENENQDKLPGSLGRNYSSQGLTGRKPLEYVTSLYQSREKSASLSTRYVDVGRLDLKATKAYSREPDHHLHLRIDQAIKITKENRTPSIRKEGKGTQSLHDRASRAGILGSKNEKHRSEANLEKGWKPSNIVTNMTSFIPLVKKKQQPTTVKRDVRVKALEAAEATKRRAEKKQNEREMRKAAAELERGRLKQEREQKQKFVEQKKKLDADIVARKRQREDDEKKEKERKKKCIEEARKQQKQQVERMHAPNGEKDACRKDSGDKELGKDLVGGVKSQLIPDERTESVIRFISSESNKLKAVVADGRSDSSGLQVQESLSEDVDKSYEMSPYKDSDEEDVDDLEHKEEVGRRRKLIPSWARKEFLDKIFLHNQNLDPREIFARKCSFNLSDVLPVHIPQRRFN